MHFKVQTEEQIRKQVLFVLPVIALIFLPALADKFDINSLEQFAFRFNISVVAILWICATIIFAIFSAVIFLVIKNYYILNIDPSGILLEQRSGEKVEYIPRDLVKSTTLTKEARHTRRGTTYHYYINITQTSGNVLTYRFKKASAWPEALTTLASAGYISPLEAEEMKQSLRSWWSKVFSKK